VIHAPAAISSFVLVVRCAWGHLSAGTQPNADPLEERMTRLDDALALDSRLQQLEKVIRERVSEKKAWWRDKIWWRDKANVAILAAFISAILPAATWIQNVYTNHREYSRQILDQQEKVRETYLEKVLKPGVTISEQQQIFGLLKELSADREMQRWAQKAYEENTRLVILLDNQRDKAIKMKQDLCVKFISGTASPLDKGQILAADREIRELNRKLTIQDHTFGCTKFLD
jgi:hypothetical protein